MPQAFEGIRIIDFTQVLAGPYGVMQLALLGAEVIKIEQPESGDQTRGLMNTNADTSMSPSFMTCNVNKKSITLNLKAPEAIDIVTRLVASADAVVENFKAGTMERLGLGYEDLIAHNPSLIYCSVTGYGQKGPKAGAAAYDGAIQAASGMMSQTGHPDTGPTRTGYMPVDMSTALNTAFALSAALYRKQVTGEGQRLDVAMMDTAIVAQAAQYSNFINQGSLVGLLGNASPTRQPTADVFPTADGFLQVTALRQPQVEKFFDALGIADLLGMPEFATPESRISHPYLVKEAIREAMAARTTLDWATILQAIGLPIAEIRELPEVLEDEQFKYRKVFTEIDSPVTPGKKITIIKAGYETNQDGPEVRTPPPLLGQHNSEVLASIGYDEADIQRLKEAGVV